MAVLFAVLAVVLRRLAIILFAHFIARILVGAGLAFVAYKVAIGPLFAELHSLVNATSSSIALEWFGYFRIDQAITVLISAYTIRLTAKSLHLVKT